MNIVLRIKKLYILFSPLALIGVTWLNMFQLYFNWNRNNTIRMAFVWGIWIVLCMMSLIVIADIIKHRCSKKEFFLILLLNIFYFMLYVMAFFRFGVTVALCKKATIGCIKFILIISLVLLIIKEHKQVELLKYTTILSLLMIPIFLWYIFRIFIGQGSMYELISIGNEISYMSIAYLALSLLLASFLNVLFISEKMSSKRKICNIGIQIVCAITIVESGCRGALLGAIILSASYMVVKKLWRKKINRFDIAIVLASLLCLILFETLIIPEKSGTSRLKKNAYSTVNSESIDSLDKQALELATKINMEVGDLQQLQQLWKEAEKTTSLSSFKLTWEVCQYIETPEAYNIAAEFNNTDRIYLYLLAIKEFIHNPLIGNGPLSFQMKYGTYPHNFILEFMSDFGCIGIFFLLLIAFFLIKQIYGKKEIKFEKSGLFLCFLTFLPRLIFSTDIYWSEEVIFLVLIVSLKHYFDNNAMLGDT